MPTSSANGTRPAAQLEVRDFAAGYGKAAIVSGIKLDVALPVDHHVDRCVRVERDRIRQHVHRANRTAGRSGARSGTEAR